MEGSKLEGTKRGKRERWEYKGGGSVIREEFVPLYTSTNPYLRMRTTKATSTIQDRSTTPFPLGVEQRNLTSGHVYKSEHEN